MIVLFLKLTLMWYIHKGVSTPLENPTSPPNTYNTSLYPTIECSCKHPGLSPLDLSINSQTFSAEMKQKLLVLVLSFCILFYTLSVLLPFDDNNHNMKEFSLDSRNIDGKCNFSVEISKLFLSFITLFLSKTIQNSYKNHDILNYRYQWSLKDGFQHIYIIHET